MKRVFLFTMLALFPLAVASAGEDHAHHAAAKSALMDRLKPLVGTWETEVKGQKVRTTYSLAANGTALMENLMPESMAMINMMHADGDGVLMTHYCSGGSQPRYRAEKANGNSIVFTLVDGRNLGDSYMKGVKLTLIDDDHLTQEWTNLKGGKEESWKFEFARVK